MLQYLPGDMIGEIARKFILCDDYRALALVCKRIYVILSGPNKFGQFPYYWSISTDGTKEFCFYHGDFRLTLQDTRGWQYSGPKKYLEIGPNLSEFIFGCKFIDLRFECGSETIIYMQIDHLCHVVYRKFYDEDSGMARIPIGSFAKDKNGCRYFNPFSKLAFKKEHNTALNKVSLTILKMLPKHPIVPIVIMLLLIRM